MRNIREEGRERSEKRNYKYQRSGLRDIRKEGRIEI